MKKKMILTAALLLTLSVALIAGCAQQSTGAEAQGILADTGTLILRVNPEISVQYNKDGLVTKITGLNDDAEPIVSGYDDYIGKDCKSVVRDLVGKINDAGYFVADVDGGSRNITIQIEPGSVLPEDDFLQNIASDVQVAVADMKAKARVVGIGHTDYDARYAQGGVPSSYITKEKAAEIALAHAGVQATDALFDDREFDFEGGRAVYELEFISGGKEYKYDIDAKTGSVLRHRGEQAGYGDTDYGPDNDGVTDYGVTDYGDTDYGPNNDGITDYGDTDYGLNNDGITDYGVTDYGDTDYGLNNDGDTNYGDTNYDSGYGSKTTAPTAAPTRTPSAGGDSDYGNSSYGDTSYGDTNYGDTNYDSGYGSSGYGNSGYDSGYGNS